MKLSLAAALAAGLATPVLAMPVNPQPVQLIVNGGFESTNMSDSTQFGSSFPSGGVTGWSASGLNAVYFPGTAERGATTQFGYRDMKVYGPANGWNNGLTATSPAGGNFVMMDGDPSYQGIVWQTVSGLTAGKTYDLSFWWAAGQQFNFPGATWDKYMTVSLGSQSFDTEKLSGPTGSFQGWRQVTASFTAQNATEVLRFAAHGMPSGQPPLVFLDGVSMTAAVAAVPEPATWAMLILGFGLVGGVARRRGMAQVAA